MKEIDFSNVDQFEYTRIRESIEEIFNETKEMYNLDIMISLFEDIKSHIEDENGIQL